MKAKLSVLLAAAGLVLAAVPAYAHHAFSAEFDGTQPVTLKGTLTKLEWVNPHGWVYMDVKNPDGTVTNWAIETGGVATDSAAIAICLRLFSTFRVDAVLVFFFLCVFFIPANAPQRGTFRCIAVQSRTSR